MWPTRSELEITSHVYNRIQSVRGLILILGLRVLPGTFCEVLVEEANLVLGMTVASSCVGEHRHQLCRRHSSEKLELSLFSLYVMLACFHIRMYVLLMYIVYYAFV